MTLTVTDLEQSADFYNRVLGSQTAVSDRDHLGPYIVCVSPNFMVGLRKWEETPEGDSFNFARVGLDHMGVHVESKDELEKWKAHLDELGVENSGLVESPFGLHLHVKDPDQIAIEFFAPSPQGRRPRDRVCSVAPRP